jgi:DNA mismatch endonuclease, patch repair protein
MARIRSTDTGPEIAARAAVRALGHHYRLHVRDLPGTPDMANKKRRWAIFVHGCFWHAHADCKRAPTPKSNADYWRPKLERNVRRDSEKIAELRAKKYNVLVIWECEMQDREVLKESLHEFFCRLF